MKNKIFLKKLLIIDDEKMILKMLKNILEETGFSITAVSSSTEGEKLAIKNNYDYLLIDLNMPEKNGLEVIETILSLKPESRIILMTSQPDIKSIRREIINNLTVVYKPINIKILMELLSV